MIPLNGYEASQLDDGLKDYDVWVEAHDVRRLYSVQARSIEEAEDAATDKALCDLYVEVL